MPYESSIWRAASMRLPRFLGVSVPPRIFWPNYAVCFSWLLPSSSTIVLLFSYSYGFLILWARAEIGIILSAFACLLTGVGCIDCLYVLLFSLKMALLIGELWLFDPWFSTRIESDSSKPLRLFDLRLSWTLEIPWAKFTDARFAKLWLTWSFCSLFLRLTSPESILRFFSEDIPTMLCRETVFSFMFWMVLLYRTPSARFLLRFSGDLMLPSRLWLRRSFSFATSRSC